MGTLFVLGFNHRTAPVELREQLAIGKDKLQEVLRSTHATGALAEVMILSTCNRVEVYGVAEAVDQARGQAFGLLCKDRGVELASLERVLYTKIHAEAVRHCFRVASSLDSMILGEPQILGQVKDAFSLAQQCGSVGPLLHGMMSQAFTVAKRVKTETEVARHPVSVPKAAVELAKRIFGDLAGRTVLIFGAGEMAEVAVQHLREEGVQSILVSNRSCTRARELADRLGGRAIHLDDAKREIVQADVVICSTGAPHHILRRSDMEEVTCLRKNRPIFLIDIAVPRNIDPTVNELDNVYLYDIDDLQEVVRANLEARQKEAVRAEAIVEKEVDRFVGRLRSREAVPTIISLREKVEAIRVAELSSALTRLGRVSPEEQAAVEALTTSLVNKILHAPLAELNRQSALGNGHLYVKAVQRLFGLEEMQGR